MLERILYDLLAVKIVELWLSKHLMATVGRLGWNRVQSLDVTAYNSDTND